MPAILLAVMLLFVQCRKGRLVWLDQEGDGDRVEAVNPVSPDQSEQKPEQEAESVMHFADSDEIVRYMDESPVAARYRKGILPAMARTAPEYAERLLNSRYPRFVVADKGSMRVIVYDSCGVELRSFKMAAGKKYGNKHKRRDMRTPEGFFSVEGIYNSTEWLFTDDDGNTSKKKGQYGPRFIRLAIPTTSAIGIHGTCAPWSVGGRRSHGCMRVNNDDIFQLVALVEKGMPVIVNPSSRDQEVNMLENSPVRKIYTGHEEVANGRPTRLVAESVEGQSADTVVEAELEVELQKEETMTAEPDSVV